MSFGFIILIRVLFVACMVFIIGYVFGNFSKSLVLRRITRVAAILAIVLFILSNVLTMRFAWGIHPGGSHCAGLPDRGWCNHHYNDSTAIHNEHFRELDNP